MRPTAILVEHGSGQGGRRARVGGGAPAGTLAGAALDVYEFEPAVSEGLLELDNVVLTPHIASATRDTRLAMGMLCVDALRAVLLEGRTPVERRVASGHAAVRERVHDRDARSASSCGRRSPRTSSAGASTDGERRPTTRRQSPSTRRFRALLEEAGAEVVVSRHDPGNPDAIYVYDPVLVGSDGAVLLRPGKEGRRGEPAALVATLEAAGVPVAGELAAPSLRRGR